MSTWKSKSPPIRHLCRVRSPLFSLFPSSSTFAVGEHSSILYVPGHMYHSLNFAAHLYPSSLAAHIHVHLFFSTCMLHSCFYVHEPVVRFEVQSEITSIESRTEAKEVMIRACVLLPVMTSWWCHTYAVSRSFSSREKVFGILLLHFFSIQSSSIDFYGSNNFDI
jgi:hypothetical protein